MTSVLDLVGRIGHALVYDRGVQHGDRVAIAMRNHPEWIAAFAAITSVGAIAVPMNAWWQTDEMVFALDDSGCRVVFVDDERLARLRTADAGDVTATSVLVRGHAPVPAEDGVDVVRLDDLLTPGAELPDVDID